MSLRETGDRVRPTASTKKGQSKVDTLLALMGEGDREAFHEWLHDPTWSSHAICKALTAYSKDQGKDYTCGHSTIDNWRMKNNVAVPQS